MSLRRKITPFVFGVLIGLLAGVGFFIFKINDWFQKLRDTANERITVIEQPVKTVPDPGTTKEREKKTPREKFKVDLGKNDKVNYREVDSLIIQDSKINIATEELLSVKNVKVIKITDNAAASDSAAALAGVTEPEQEIFQVEFWKTPLNSRGYRFAKKKVMLYGFPDFSNILIYEADGGYFLRAADQLFRLTYSAEFRQLEKVTDPDLLSRFS